MRNTLDTLVRLDVFRIHTIGHILQDTIVQASFLFEPITRETGATFRLGSVGSAVLGFSGHTDIIQKKEILLAELAGRSIRILFTIGDLILDSCADAAFEVVVFSTLVADLIGGIPDTPDDSVGVSHARELGGSEVVASLALLAHIFRSLVHFALVNTLESDSANTGAEEVVAVLTEGALEGRAVERRVDVIGRAEFDLSEIEALVDRLAGQMGHKHVVLA